VRGRLECAKLDVHIGTLLLSIPTSHASRGELVGLVAGARRRRFPEKVLARDVAHAALPLCPALPPPDEWGQHSSRILRSQARGTLARCCNQMPTDLAGCVCR
jgi:hypothetical protein